MKKIKYILLMCVMLFMLVACGNKEADIETNGTEQTENNVESSKEAGDRATSEDESVMLFGHFDSQTLEGKEVTEEIFSDAELTMVNIWGTYCGPCVAEMPDLGEISREYADKEFQVIGIICDATEPGNEDAVEIVDKTGADYTHLIASDDLIMNALQYVSSVPTTVFVDKKGYLVGEVYSGARDKATWEQIINQNLAEVK